MVTAIATKHPSIGLGLVDLFPVVKRRAYALRRFAGLTAGNFSLTFPHFRRGAPGSSAHAFKHAV